MFRVSPTTYPFSGFLESWPDQARACVHLQRGTLGHRPLQPSWGPALNVRARAVPVRTARPHLLLTCKPAIDPARHGRYVHTGIPACHATPVFRGGGVGIPLKG